MKCSANIRIGYYEGSILVEEMIFPFNADNEQNFSVRFGKTVWNVRCVVTPVKINKGEAFNIQIIYLPSENDTTQTKMGIRFDFEQWSEENYILMPAAAYAGNRFEARKMKYPPQLYEEADLDPSCPIIISDVPRLEIDKNRPSGIQLLAGDMATPAIGIYSKNKKRGAFLLSHQRTTVGETGFSIKENEDRDKTSIEISIPGIRSGHKYRMCDNTVPSDDRGVDLETGESAELNSRIYFFECDDVRQFFDYFVDIRKDLSGEPVLRHILPFSGAWEILEKKYNEQNWEDIYGYYSVGMRESIYADWQIGWVGGMMCTYPLLLEGSDISRVRCIRNFDFVFAEGQSKSGFFHGCGHKGKWYGDCFRDVNKPWHLIRKSGDALYYIIKQFMLMDEMEKRLYCTIPRKRKWIEGAKRCAEAFVQLWRRYGQFGQYINTETGDIIIGGSTSAAIAPAALALCWRYFGDDNYIETAKASAEYFYNNFTCQGISVGGPGEILQCPDSESSFALLESYVVLYETSGETKWLDMAVDMANQCITWCMSYDFNFPEGSVFGILDMRTAGSVFANVQNKHSAPGICTLSGDSLFKLFRYTGDERYLKIIKESSHNLTQYISREDRPIRAENGRNMPEGWVNERVETSDWLEPVGEVFYGSCWSEVSIMMTYAEIPGIYLHTDTGYMCVMDNVDARVISNDNRKLIVKMHNPTCFDAEVKIFAERSFDMNQIIGQNAMLNSYRAIVKAGKYTEFIYNKE